jgi:hypothetical protein
MRCTLRLRRPHGYCAVSAAEWRGAGNVIALGARVDAHPDLERYVDEILSQR